MAILGERDWSNLLERIKDGKCTPFLGAGACFGSIPLGAQLAAEWATAEGYPLEDTSDLARVSQYIAVMSDPMVPKERINRLFSKLKEPDFGVDNEPHGVLAALPLPVYITTNYDNFMTAALRANHKDPRQEICRWNKYLKGEGESVFQDGQYRPTPASPTVFHLHGYFHLPESLVLTEDDYFDFLARLSEDKDLIPERIRRVFSGSSLLFLGYRLADTDFRVLFRTLVEYLEKSIARAHVSVQLAPPDGMSEAKREKIQKYLDNYFGSLNIRVYWGTCREFVAELDRRWKAFNG